MVCRLRRRNLLWLTTLLLIPLALRLLRYFSAPIFDRDTVIRQQEAILQEALKEDKGTGCQMTKLDPFNEEIMQFVKKYDNIECDGIDWVKCYFSQCRVVPIILETMKNIKCWYSDILYQNDNHHVIGAPTLVKGDQVYDLVESDHVKIHCTGKHKTKRLLEKWKGYSIGFRSMKPKKPNKGRENTMNVLILGFDSTSKNGFIRHMPKSYQVLTQDLQAVVLNSYNIVGDGTPAALFPILTGKTELELPESRKSIKNSGYCDDMPFIFYKLKEDGYRTAFFEDSPNIGTFQLRFHGFQKQPADHYLHAFNLEATSKSSFCIGDTPQYKNMINITDQFLRLDGKRFAFTFIVDITHDDINHLANADEDVANFLKNFEPNRKLSKDTLLIVMGDHGPRYSDVRNTLQGKLEERLPLMAIKLPEALQMERPDALTNLRNNIDTLTTPHDIHATVLDVLGMTQHWNTYKVPGADLPRAMTLLQTVPKTRSCSEAEILPHWCACVIWYPVPPTDPLYASAATALLGHINYLTESMRSLCALRTLTSIEWVRSQRPKSSMLAFVGALDSDGYVGKFANPLRYKTQFIQAKIVVGPKRGVYEGTVTYDISKNKFYLSNRDISRINAYGDEPSCISNTYPHLNKYCYCN